MKKVVSLIVLLIVTNLPISCGLRCGSDVAEFSTITSMTSEIGQLTPNGYNDNQPTNFEEAAIIILVDGVEYFDKVSIERPKYSIIGAAYACSPVPSKPFQKLEKIEITSTEDVFIDGEEFKQGVLLNDIFITNSSSGANLTIDEFLQAQSDEWDRFSALQPYVVFALKVKPDSIVSQRFAFTFTFDDGLKYKVETPIFTVE